MMLLMVEGLIIVALIQVGVFLGIQLIVGVGLYFVLILSLQRGGKCNRELLLIARMNNFHLEQIKNYVNYSI